LYGEIKALTDLALGPQREEPGRRSIRRRADSGWKIMQYTRNDWYVACLEKDLPIGQPYPALVLNERMVLWRSDQGVFALEDRCVHRAAALSLGRCEGANLRCMYHGMLFDPAGRAVEIPGQDVIPPNAKVRAYPVRARHGLIWVWMGNEAEGDPSRIPDLFESVDLADYHTGCGVLDFAAEARLISDNLLDFSHLPYVHGASFGASDEWARTTIRTTPIERGVRFERWLEDGHTGDFLFGPTSTPTDDWLCYDYLIPGVLIMWIGVYSAGTARRLNHGRPDFSAALGQVNVHIQTITPTTEKTCRYHYVVGIHRDFSSDPLVEKFVAITGQAFNEDRRVIEAQQKVIDRAPDRPILPTVHDRGVTIYNRLKARLIAEERGEGEKALDLAVAD
jgi:vanillate O-demethylase monooxygenase subunit